MWVCMVCRHVVSLVFFNYCVNHHGGVFYVKSQTSHAELRVRKEFVQCEKFITMCINLSKVSCCSLWEQFTFGSSL